LPGTQAVAAGTATRGFRNLLTIVRPDGETVNGP
jgi:hypothetical protein